MAVVHAGTLYTQQSSVFSQTLLYGQISRSQVLNGLYERVFILLEATENPVMDHNNRSLIRAIVRTNIKERVI